MNTSSPHTYQRIAKAMAFVQAHHREQPRLEDIAAHVQLSPFHFQRLFADWVGTTPKKFLQYITLSHAKALLQDPGATLLDVASEAGLSGTGRLHDLFVQIEAMTPGEYQRGGEGLLLRHSMAATPFGPVLLCSSDRGLVAMVYGETEAEALHSVQARFPNAQFVSGHDAHQARALRIFEGDWGDEQALRLHLKGTPFQLKVWEALLKIPAGRLSTYSQVARQIGHDKAVRAVGTAVGDNPVAYLIPCHRVITQSGLLGGYRWGLPRKLAMLGWEGVRHGPESSNAQV
jgi:AraC family transcriptional regulator, regulatory protein of adaptative response / methylated-DNA-[protein]-cysteine methyltransferase